MRIAKTWDEVNPVLYDGDEAVSTRVLEKQYRDALDRIDFLEISLQLRTAELKTQIAKDYRLINELEDRLADALAAPELSR